MAHHCVLTVWIVNAPGSPKSSCGRDFKEESVFVVESHYSCVCGYFKDAHFLLSRGFRYLLQLLFCRYLRLMKLSFANSLF